MRRAFKISAWTVGAAAPLIVVLFGILFIGGNTDSGRAMIEKWTHRLTSGHVSLSALAGSFPQHLTVDRLDLSYDRGFWLRAQRVIPDWSPPALFARRLQIDRLYA